MLATSARGGRIFLGAGAIKTGKTRRGGRRKSAYCEDLPHCQPVLARIIEQLRGNVIVCAKGSYDGTASLTTMSSYYSSNKKKPGLCPGFFSKLVAGTGFEPVTFGL